jgi:hypothetical protein
VGANPAVPGRRLLSPTRPPEPPRASARPTSWTRPTQPVRWNQAPGPMSGAGSPPLPTQAKGTPAQGPLVKSTASLGEQAASSDRQLSYAAVRAAYAGVVAGRPVKGATAGVHSLAPLPTKNGASQEGKERDERASCGAPPVLKSTCGDKDVTVGNTAGAHLDA